MATVTFIMGESGTGKSYSIRNLKPDSVALINVNGKPLPLRGQWPALVSDNAAKIISAIRKTERKIIIIDDAQYLMSNTFMRRSAETGFQKFTDIARDMWDLVMAATDLKHDVRVYIMIHSTNDDAGRTRIKTIGKLLDEKIVLEGMVTIVLKTIVMNGNYLLCTQNSGQDTVKSPPSMFGGEMIENDLAAVDSAICNYYSIVDEK